MLENFRNKIRDIAQGFYWAYFTRKDKWYRNVIAYQRMSRCLVCSSRRHNKCSMCGCYLIPKSYSITPTNHCPRDFWMPVIMSHKERGYFISRLEKDAIDKVFDLVKKHEKDSTLIKSIIELELKSVLLLKDDSKEDLLLLENCLKLFNYKTICNEQFSKVRAKRKTVIRRFAGIFRSV